MITSLIIVLWEDGHNCNEEERKKTTKKKRAAGSSNFKRKNRKKWRETKKKTDRKNIYATCFRIRILRAY